MTFEAAVTKTLDALSADDPEQIRRVSDTAAYRGKLMRKGTVSALKRRNTEYKRKETMRRRPRGKNTFKSSFVGIKSA